MQAVGQSVIQWFHHLMLNFHWKGLWALLGFLDWFAGVFLLIGIVYGMKKGFVRVVVQVFEFVLILWLVYGNYRGFSLVLQNSFKLLPWRYSDIVSYFTLLAVIWTAVLIIDATLGRWIKAQTAAPLRLLGGIAGGPVYFLLIFSLISKGLVLLSFEWIQRLYAPGASLSGPFFVNLTPQVYNYLMRITSAIF